MQGNSRSGLIGNDGSALVIDAAALRCAQPSVFGDGTAAPAGDPLPNIGAGPLLFLQVLVQCRRREVELPGGIDLREPFGGDEVFQEPLSWTANHGRYRFMNRNGPEVKCHLQIHEPERAKLGIVKAEKQPGRPSDDAVAWYLRMRLEKIIDIERSKTQAEIADEADIPRSALSNIYLHSRGAGPGTSGPLAKFLGFKSRGEMVDEADRWFATPEGREFLLDRVSPRERDRHFPKKARRKTA